MVSKAVALSFMAEGSFTWVPATVAPTIVEAKVAAIEAPADRYIICARSTWVVVVEKTFWAHVEIATRGYCAK